MREPSSSESCSLPRYELYAHAADVGIRGFGADPAQAFEAAALALTSAICSPEMVFPNHRVELHCQGANLEDLLYEWINALVYEMATRRMLFSRFRVTVAGVELGAEAWGEPLDIQRHQPAVEVKGATYTDLKVIELRPGTWTAQCIIDV
jgi:SHS2 domain-containing protein